MNKKLLLILVVNTILLIINILLVTYDVKVEDTINNNHNNKFYYDCEGNELKGLNPDLIQLFIYNYCVVLNDEDSIKLNDFIYGK